MSTKIHFRDYNPKQMILFPQRLDKDIAEDDQRTKVLVNGGSALHFADFLRTFNHEVLIEHLFKIYTWRDNFNSFGSL